MALGEMSGADVEAEYVVERIVGSKLINGVVYYHLKWKGFPNSENTWEPVTNLECEELIADFEQQQLQSSPGPAEGETSFPDKRHKRKRRAAAKTCLDFLHKPALVVDADFTAEAIVDHKMVDGVLFFLVKWEDYGPDENTWEPADNLDCKAIMAAYCEQFPEVLEDLKRHEKDSNVADLRGKAVKKENIEKSVPVSMAENNLEKTPKSIPVVHLEESPVESEISDQSPRRSKAKMKRNLKIQEVCGVLRTDGKISYTIKWEGEKEVDVLSSAECRRQFPAVIAEFLERSIKWSD